MKRFVPCLSNDFGNDFLGDDMLPGLICETLGEERGALCIVDELGEDFLHPTKQFLRLTDAQSAQLERSMLAAA
jgi:hypothetical protein